MEQEQKRRYFKPSEINQFTFCTESWRLDKLKKQRKIFLTSEDYQTLKTRFQRGNEHHKDFYNKLVYQGRRKSTSLVKIAFYGPALCRRALGKIKKLNEKTNISSKQGDVFLY